jgi:hypothetical protein
VHHVETRASRGGGGGKGRTDVFVEFEGQGGEHLAGVVRTLAANSAITTDVTVLSNRGSAEKGEGRLMI